MPFLEVKGDLFQGDVDALAHGVNCAGVMGAGIAATFASRSPKMLKWYQERCEAKRIRPGQCWTWAAEGKPYVFNLATQNRPGPDAKLRWIASSVADMLQRSEVATDVTSVGIPRIGCGIGGLQWVEVRMILELLANESPVDLVVYSP